MTLPEPSQVKITRSSSSGRMRLLVGVGAGVVVGVLLSVVLSVRYGALAGLMVTAATYTAWTFLALRRFDALETRHHAKREDAGRALTDAVGAGVILADVAMVVLILVSHQDATKTVDAVLAVGAIALSWFLLHTLFLGRYARQYYADDGTGGIDFNDDDREPTYADFTYFSFNLGMTYQVSDTAVSKPEIRRTVLRHCMLSYFFGTGITATVINLVVGLAS